MIDCDSFQLSHGGKTWFCNVGVGTHQPPEMQGRDSYAGVTRTANHDSFGLAVLVFQLLCMARHPFAGRYLGIGEPPSIEEAITACRYAYSRERSRTQMEAPPGSLPVDALSPEIQDLFERAFSPGASRGGRPVADQWASALGKLATDLKPCRSNPAHYFRNGLSTCPWCSIENSSGVILFPVVFVPGLAGVGGMAAIWQEVGKVADPPPLPPWPSNPPGKGSPSSEAKQAAKNGLGMKVAAWTSVAAAVVITLAFATPQARALLVPAIGVLTFLIIQHTKSLHPGPFRKRLADLKRDWDTLRSSWMLPTTGQTSSEVRGSLTKLKAEYRCPTGRTVSTAATPSRTTSRQTAFGPPRQVSNRKWQDSGDRRRAGCDAVQPWH